MTAKQSKHDAQFPATRRDVLKLAAVGAGVTALGGIGFTGRVAADSHVIETLYLTDSGGDNAGDFLTKLFTVELTEDPDPEAQLTLEYEVEDPDFDQVDAIAASLDGTTVYMVDKTSRHLGIYDAESGTFSDAGVIAGLPGGTVLATYSPDGRLLVASQNTNAMYTIDVDVPSATHLVDISGAPVQGADIAFDADEVLYLYSSSTRSLYTIDYDSSSGTFGEATSVGQTGDFFTGLAVREAGAGELVGSNTTRDEIVVINKGNGAQMANFPMYVGEDRYAYGYGDMTVGFLDVETCDPCELPTGVKFEYDEGMDAFVLDGEESYGITFEGYESKPGEMYEPISATFGTGFCTLWAVVKAGQEFSVQELEAEDGTVTAHYAEPYAISFVEFYCTEDEAETAVAAFPSNGKGRGRGD